MSAHHHDHSHTHSHSGHHHGHGHLNAALALTALFAAVELVGGLMSGSLALLADAGHMVSDVAALGIASIAAQIAGRPAHKGMTYGYGRARIIAAQINGLALCFLAGWIVWEAVGRIVSPPQVDGSIMSAIAFIGLIVNLIVLRWLHGGDDLNTKAAYWHVLGDTLGSVAALIGGAVILTTGWMLIDPLLSFLVSALLAWGGWRLIRQTTFELMEAVPAGVNRDEIIDSVREIDGICDMHHVHIWRLPSGELAMSAHVECEGMNNWSTVLKQLHACVAEFGVTHATFQPEEGPCHARDSSCH
ncbi:MAG TPA: cation diffusion facilitator family transporter [Mariprofundaceae bacterium]|nr:cation diffusion facilitator family transporter [Mariprofundaceae bacterium]